MDGLYEQEFKRRNMNGQLRKHIVNTQGIPIKTRYHSHVQHVYNH